MWELDYKESWVPKNWCFWTVVLEKALESPLDSKEIQLVHPKGDQSWGTDVEAETPVLWPPDARSWLIWKGPDAGKDWRQEEKWMTEDEMVRWHYWLNGHGFGWTWGVGDGQGGLVCCGSWGRKELDTTERLNWLIWYLGRTCNHPVTGDERRKGDFSVPFLENNLHRWDKSTHPYRLPLKILLKMVVSLFLMVTKEEPSFTCMSWAYSYFPERQ